MNELAHPCPTCGQYSHSLGSDRVTEAYNHFQAMVCENPLKPYPTGYAFPQETRDAAKVLMAAIPYVVYDDEPSTDGWWPGFAVGFIAAMVMSAFVWWPV